MKKELSATQYQHIGNLLTNANEKQLDDILWFVIKLYADSRAERFGQKILNLVDDYRKTCKTKDGRKELQDLWLAIRRAVKQLRMS